MPDFFDQFGPDVRSVKSEDIDLEALVLGGNKAEQQFTQIPGSFHDFMEYDSAHLLEKDEWWYATFKREVSVELEYLDDGTASVMLTERFYPSHYSQNMQMAVHASPKGIKKCVETIVHNGMLVAVINPLLNAFVAQPKYEERRLLVNLPFADCNDSVDCEFGDRDAEISCDVQFAREARELLLQQYLTVYGMEMDLTRVEDLIITQLAKEFYK